MVSRPEFASLQGFAFNGAFPYTGMLVFCGVWVARGADQPTYADRDIIMPAMIVKNLVRNGPW